jgi:hypothetical protein
MRLTVRELESGTIKVLRNGEAIIPVKPFLRELATRCTIGLAGRGNPTIRDSLGRW